MTRDFKHADTHNNANSGSVYWMIGGIVIGLLTGFAMYYFISWNAASKLPIAHKSTPSDDQYSSSSKPALAPSQTQVIQLNQSGKTIKEQETETKPKRPHFSYYAVLPNTELDVEIETIQVRTLPINNTVSKPVAVKAGDYMLQLASLKTLDRANRAKEALNQQGLLTSIQKTNVKGAVWYRLLAGPVTGENAFANLKDQVISLGFKPITIKVR